MVEDEDLDAFASGDEKAARIAFERLDRASRPNLVRWLTARTRNLTLAEEAAQDTLTRAWAARDGYRNQGTSSWFAYLKRIAGHLLIDQATMAYMNDLEFEDQNLPHPEDLSIVTDIHLALMANRAYWLANILWLGLDGTLSAEVHDRQLLVAVRYFLDGEPLNEILASMPSPPADEPPLSLRLLNDWTRHPGVLRYLIFHTLYFGNERLALYVLGLEDTRDGRRRLNDLEAQCGAGLSHADEIEGCPISVSGIALWRYRRALTPDQIRTKYRDELAALQVDEKQFSEICALLAGREPFLERVGELQRTFQARQSTPGEDLLRDDGPWRRLVFQYEYHDDVPLPEIVRRVQNPAAAVGFHLTPDMINSWTNGKQLCRQLAKFWRKSFEGDFDE